MSCHQEIPDERLSAPAKGMEHDVHTKHGFSCSDCHGGDRSAVDDFVAAHSDSRGFKGSPDALTEPGLCAGCHSDPVFMKKYNPNIGVDQLSLFRTSVHGIKNSQGDTKVAHCTSCHGVHGIRSSDDPLSPVYPVNVPTTCSKCHSDETYMEPYRVPTDQMSEYSTSVHGNALLEEGERTAPACNDCHGNHGAVPPGIASVSEVCGQCHSAQLALFSASPHKEAHEAMDLPACEVCHGNHEVTRPDDSMLGVSEGAVCAECHDEDSSGHAVASKLRELIDGLREKHESVAALVNTAEQAGMTMDEAAFEMNEGRSALLRARTAVHAFSVEAVEMEVGSGQEHLLKAETSASAALSEISLRRKWFVGLAILGVVMALALIRKMRDADRAVLRG
ncbi:MAG: cytochrome c3 family protein [Candidatus Eiseniibacteriota bacterium]|nr:MAG: cytochrome c3 family protein [Candidatus Eisenbacteria bacterium]